MIFGYARVSTRDQNLDRQLAILKEAGCEQVRTEKLSGKDRQRPELENLLNYLRAGDVLIVTSLDRLSRSLIDAKTIIEEVRAKGATLKLIKENMTLTPDGSDYMTNLVINIFAALAEFERENIRERQAEGIAIAKAKGVYAKPRKMTRKTTTEVHRLRDLGISKADIARRLGISRASVYRALADAGTRQT